MTAPLSLTSTFKLAKQTAKGTAATRNFICGRFTQSNLQAVYEYIEAQAEHFCGLDLRPTLRKSLSRKSGYVVPFGGQGFLYPDTIGHVLTGLGFAIANPPTTDSDGFIHTIEISDRASAGWLTAHQSIGDGADLFDRRVTDGRIEQWSITAGARGIQQTFAGFGIKEDTASVLEEEEITVEGDHMLLPSKGSATISVNGTAFTSAIRGLQFMVSNPLDRREQTLFSFERSDLPAQGMEIGGSMMGIDVDKDIYNRLMWGGTGGTPAGTGPTQAAVPGEVSFTFQSAEEYTTGKPWSLTVAIPKVEMRMGNFAARGRDLIRFDLAFLMIDDSSTPLTLTLKNTIDSYLAVAAA